MADFVPCQTCRKAYFEGGLISVVNRPGGYHIEIESDDGTRFSCFVSENSASFKELLHGEGVQRYCVGCVGSLLMTMLSRCLNHQHSRCFKDEEVG